MRLFVAAWPPPEVIDRWRGRWSSEHPGFRWADPDQWHVTLVFLGEVPEVDCPALSSALIDAVTRITTPEAVLGPFTRSLGRGVLCVPVSGLDELASVVRVAVSPFGGSLRPEERFVGHLTIGKAGRGRRVPAELVGQPFEERWKVGEILLVSSRLSHQGSQFETVARTPPRPSHYEQVFEG